LGAAEDPTCLSERVCLDLFAEPLLRAGCAALTARELEVRRLVARG